MAKFRLTLILAALLSSTFAAEVPEDFGLGWGSDASALEAALFAHRWLHDHPAESVRLVDLGPPNDPKAKDTFAVYTKGNDVKLHIPKAAPLTLPDVKPADVESGQNLREVVAKKLGPYEARKVPAPADLPKSYSELATLIEMASDGTHFPSAASLVPSVRKKPDGTREEVSVECLVFDFADQHYAWRLSGAPSHVHLPPHERFGGIHPCVKYGDLLDAVLIKAGARRSADHTPLRLAFPGIASGGPSVGTASLVFADNGKLGVYNLFIGTSSIEDTVPADLERDVFTSWISWQLISSHLKQHDNDGDNVPVAKLEEVYTTLKACTPEALPGDTPLLQLRRVAQLLTLERLPVDLDEELGVLRFRFEQRDFGYSAARGGWIESPESTSERRDRARVSQLIMIQGNHFSSLAAADKGNSFDLLEVGTLLLSGHQVPIDDVLGQRYLVKAYEKGETSAALELGRYLTEKPFATDEDYKKAAIYLKVAAEDGFPEAIFSYGTLFANGNGVKRDPVEGLAWMLVGDHSFETKDILSRFRRDNLDHPEWNELAEKRAEEIRAHLTTIKDAKAAGATPPKSS